MLLSLSSPVLQAQERLPVGASFFPPFEYMENDKSVGANTEIIDAVLRRMGYDPDIAIHPWKRILVEGIAGKYAVIHSFTKTPEREKNFYFTEPLNFVQDVFFKRKDRDIQWEVLEDLSPFVVSASESYNYDESFNRAAKNHLFKINWVLGDRPEITHLKLLEAGRVDIAICEISVCQFLIQHSLREFGEIDFISRPIGPFRSFHAGFSKAWPGSEQLVVAFNVHLKAFIASGKRDEILNRYGIASQPD